MRKREDSGMESMIGKKVCVFCAVYIYTGVLSDVSDEHIELTSPYLVYETGDLTSEEWRDAQELPGPWNIQKTAIESWGPAKC